MAGKKKTKSLKGDKYLVIKKLLAAVAMVSFVVIIIAGLQSEARFITIAYRATGVMLVVFVVSRIIIKIISGYEEMNSGKT